MNRLNTLKTVLAFLICVTFVSKYLFEEYKNIILPLCVAFFALYIIVSVYGWIQSRNNKN